MTQAHSPSSPSGAAPLAQAWDDLIKWLSHAPPSVQAQAMQNPQAALSQFGLGGVSGPQLQSAITHSGSYNNTGHTVNQGTGNVTMGSGNFGGSAGGSGGACPPGAPPSEVFNHYVSNNYSSIVDNSVHVGGDMNGDIDQHNVTGDHNTTTFGDEFDINGDVNGQIVTGDHSNAAGHDLDASVMGAGATRFGDDAHVGAGAFSENHGSANFGGGSQTNVAGDSIDTGGGNYAGGDYDGGGNVDTGGGDYQGDVDTGGGDYDGGTDTGGGDYVGGDDKHSSLNSGGGDVDIHGDNNV